MKPEIKPGLITVSQVLGAARERLVASGMSAAAARIDVDLFVRSILGWDRAQLLVHHSSQVPERLEPQLSQWVTRREQREPTAYILETKEFWRLDFRVTPAVLIPRPETEFIVDEALALIRTDDVQAPRIADVGTGSGCLAVSLAHELADANVVATDISADALAVAQQNARTHGVADRIAFRQASFLDEVAGTFDLIVSNPPYVRDGDKPALSADVRYEPDVALFGGTTGLRAVQAVLDAAAAKLRPGGWLVMEFGFGQEDDVIALVEGRAALRLHHVRHDLQTIPRTAIIERSNGTLRQQLS